MMRDGLSTAESAEKVTIICWKPNVEVMYYYYDYDYYY